MGRRIRVWAVVSAGAVATAAVAAAAGSGTVDRVQVGQPGRNATQGLSAALYVDVPVAQDYTQAKFDGQQGDWTGPDYTATQKPGTGRTDLSFLSEFQDAEFGVHSVPQMIQKTLVHETWSQEQRAQVRVPRVLAGRSVGTISGSAALFAEPITGSARFEAVIAFPLCLGDFAAIDFYADAPPEDTSGTAGQYLVGTTPAKQWNHDHALASTMGVKLDGPLPHPHVTARSTDNAISGVVGDCGGGLQSIPIVLQRGSAVVGRGKSGPGGKFKLPTKGAGSYRVVAALGPFKAASPAVVAR